MANEEERVKRPNDPKLSDCGAWHRLCLRVEKWRWSLAQAVTRGAVRCSAWLGNVVGVETHGKVMQVIITPNKNDESYSLRVIYV